MAAEGFSKQDNIGRAAKRSAYLRRYLSFEARGRRPLRELLAATQGAALIEMAITAPVLGLLITGLIDLSLYGGELIKAQQAVNRGLEMSMMGGPSVPATDIQDQTAEHAGVPKGEVTVTQALECAGTETSWSSSCVSGEETARYTKIQLSSAYRPSFVLANASWLKLNSKGEIPISVTGVIRVQ